MPRLLGVDIPNDKTAVISLTYLYGVGSKTARELCLKAEINPLKSARDLDEDEFVELKNVSDQVVSLAGYELELVNGTGGGAAIVSVRTEITSAPISDPTRVPRSAKRRRVCQVVTRESSLIFFLRSTHSGRWAHRTPPLGM